MPDVAVTQRAYTLRLASNNKDNGSWRQPLWATHTTVNRGAREFGDWLLTLRGGLSHSLADGHPERRVVLALSWLSVETPTLLIPKGRIIAGGSDAIPDRQTAVMIRFERILERHGVQDRDEWITACQPALKARIRADAVWVDRSACFDELVRKLSGGLDADAAADILFDLMGGAEEYFSFPAEDGMGKTDAKDFAIKAGNWLSTNLGSGTKSDASGIAESLRVLSDIDTSYVVGVSGTAALTSLSSQLGSNIEVGTDSTAVLRVLKQTVGWKGRPSKGAMALEKLGSADVVTADLWQAVSGKLREEAAEKGEQPASTIPGWMSEFRAEIERKIGMPFRTSKDHIWEYAVMFDHALRRVSAGHTWIKRAEVSRRQFEDNARDIDKVSQDAQRWLNDYCEGRGERAGSEGEYLIRRRAVEGWDEVVRHWSRKDCRSSTERIQGARELQDDPEIEKFGDIQLFEALAADEARCVWQDDKERPATQLLKDYVAARLAQRDQQRFKVPAYCHPDPLRHPVFVDFGNSRWGIEYTALKAAQDRNKLEEKLSKARSDKAREKLKAQLSSLSNLHGLSLGLWTGKAMADVPVRWRGKRLRRDLDLNHFGESGTEVVRGDRFSRALAGTPKEAVNVGGVFEQKEWSGRLQVPRRELDRLANYLEKHGLSLDQPNAWDDRAKRLRDHLRWMITFSARLRPAGPWLDYAKWLPEGWTYNAKRDFLICAANKDRGKRARLELCRLPGLRVLGVDLGQRYAAACGVWEIATRKQLEQACATADEVARDEHDLYRHVNNRTDRYDRRGRPILTTTIYRRIGPDELPDGSPHPAPWARLNRQFLIKLSGEDHAARRATSDEFDRFNDFLEWVGVERRPAREVLDLTGSKTIYPRVDKLMADAVGIARLALRRHGDYARIAYVLTATSKPFPGGRTVELTREERIDYLQEALLLWKELAHPDEEAGRFLQRYQDAWAAAQYDRWVVTEFGGPQSSAVEVDKNWSERRKRRETAKAPFRRIAEYLFDRENSDLHRLWAGRWKERTDEWRQRLRWLRAWLLPRKSKLETAEAKRLTRNVGGLSLQRLATIRSLYQVMKSFYMQPEPESLTKNIPEAGDDSLTHFGQRILDALEQMRENRVKQLSSRIVEAALGVGSENRRHWERGKRRPRQSVHKPCHAVVVENLEHYRPDEIRTRRENRQLMSWSAGKVRKFLREGCQLHGLYFREVAAAYTSRQDSRTGAPGMRCVDVSVIDFLHEARFWTREVERAQRRQQGAKGDARDRLLVQLAEFWKVKDDAEGRTAHPVRIVHRGGEVFVSADARSPAAKGIQADLNAAANIGLKALMDPDWPGAWWYVPCRSSDFKPTESTKGCPVVEAERCLKEELEQSAPAGSGRKGRKASIKVHDVVNLWRDVSQLPLNDDEWIGTAEYWPRVQSRVVEGILLAEFAIAKK
ncbi:MAG: type V CRISPR-associated protein Cas12b [Planctomycetaceae bacterium]